MLGVIYTRSSRIIIYTEYHINITMPSSPPFYSRTPPLLPRPYGAAIGTA